MARLHPVIAKAAGAFIRVRLGDLRGLDLNIFDFDYDLTWVALLLRADGTVLGRFGSRDANSSRGEYTLAGLNGALQRALVLHREASQPTVPKARSVRAEEYSAAGLLAPQACIHCHHVPEFRRTGRQAARTWRRDDEWVYPEPGNLGLILDHDQGNLVTKVLPGSASFRASLQKGDLLHRAADRPVGSIADVRYALHQAPAQGVITLEWIRQGQRRRAEVELPKGWKQTDVSWRWSLKSLQPSPQVHGDDLTVPERKFLGLPGQGLAFRQGNFVARTAQQAGLRINDVIVGVDDLSLDMSARQFEAYVRLNYQVGDVVTYHILRGRDRLHLKVKLVE